MSLGIVASARRDTSFSVLALPSLTGWWDADDASTFTYSSGVVVSQWSDKSGGANHLSVIDGTAPNRNGSQNGRTTVAYSGGRLYRTSPVMTVVDGWTMTVVAKITAGDIDGRACPVSNGTGNGYGPAWRAVTTSKIGWLRGGVAWHDASGASASTWRVLSLCRSAGTTTLYVDGTADATTWTQAPNTPSGGFTTGGHFAGYRVTGEIAEIVTCSTALGATDRSNLHSYLRTKWGTP